MVTPQPGSELLALVDIGSNAVRCVLARLEARPGFEIELRHRAQTRLGESPTDMLPPPAIKTTLQSVRRFLKRVRRERGDVRTLAVATAAVRDASNRNVLLAPLAELGVREIRILSGLEEGRLGAEAASRALPIVSGIVIDLGGGSLQLTPVEGGTIQQSSSVPIGVARLLRRFLGSDPAHPNEVVALRAEIRAQLQPLLRHAPTGGRAVISGGVANALAALALSHRAPLGSPQTKLQTHGCTLTQAEVVALRAWLEPMTLQGRASAPGVKPERADVIVVGAIVLEELLALSGYAELTVSRTSVREGVLWHEAAKLRR